MPIPTQCDILIVGGCLAGWQAALDLKEAGKEVVVVSYLTHLLEELCSAQRFHEKIPHPFFEGEGKGPGWLKSKAEKALLEAGIPYLYSTHLAECREGEGAIDVALIHRGGLQSIQCQEIIDATIEGWISKRFESLTQSEKKIIWRSLSRQESSKSIGKVAITEGNENFLLEHAYGVTYQDGDYRSYSKAVNMKKVESFTPGQTLSAGLPEVYSEVKDTSCIKIAHPGSGASPQACLEAGKALAKRVLKQGRLPIPQVENQRLEGKIQWVDGGLNSLGSSYEPSQILYVDHFDVLVVGGGTGGAPAGIGAARQGAQTLVVEFCPALGGVGTQGAIGRYWFGNRVGFTAELDKACRDLSTTEQHKAGWDIECKQHWYLKSLLEARGECWLNSMVAAAIMEGSRVIGAVIATPAGLRAVYAKAIVDATGSSDLCSAAGAETVSIGAEHVALQGTGLSPFIPGESYTNSDFDFIDDNDVSDTTSAYTCARSKFKNSFDVCNLVDSRERRRIVGDIEVSPMDIRLGRTFPDAMVKAHSNFDTHGFTVHPFFLLQPPDHAPLDAFVPLRAMLPRGLQGVIVTGLGISAHRDAMPVLRMQADVQNQGYAAGVAATIAKNGDYRSMDLKAVQDHLVEIGNLDLADLLAGDSFPLPKETIEEALATLVEDYSRLDQVFTLGEHDLLPALRTQFEKVPCLKVALILGILGDATGLSFLEDVLTNEKWDEGWNYRGMGQFGRSISAFDTVVLAYGRCAKDSGPLLNLAQALESPLAFSHIRVLVEAFESIGDPSAIPVLEKLLLANKGYQQRNLLERLQAVSDDPCDNTPRNNSLIEIHLARAIHRLKPEHPLATDTLKEYGQDLRATFARHARAVLSTL